MSDSNNQQPVEKKFRYRGSSMLPTFKPGQVLYLRPEGYTPQPGDIVVYRSHGQYIVHRVKIVKDGNLVTRGDNNPRDDEFEVSIDQVVGVVDQKDDWGKNERVPGGSYALLRAMLRWKTREIFTKMLPVIGAPYRWLKASRLLKHIWNPQVTMVQMKTSNGDVVKYVVRGKTVATWHQQESRFQYKRPYDLVIFPPR